MRISEFIDQLQEQLDEHGDLDVYVMDENQPISDAPRMAVMEAQCSSYYQWLPAYVYGSTDRKPEKNALFVSTQRGIGWRVRGADHNKEVERHREAKSHAL